MFYLLRKEERRKKNFNSTKERVRKKFQVFVSFRFSRMFHLPFSPKRNCEKKRRTKSRCKNLMTHKSSRKKHFSSDAKGNDEVEGQFNKRIGLLAFGGTCNFHNLRSQIKFAFALFALQDIRLPINGKKSEN